MSSNFTLIPTVSDMQKKKFGNVMWDGIGKIWVETQMEIWILKCINRNCVHGRQRCAKELALWKDRILTGVDTTKKNGP